MRQLFVTWDGPQVTYLQSLFLPIFNGLKRLGIETDVLQFGWSDAAQTATIAAECRSAGIGYRAAHIWRALGGIGPALSALTGARAVRRAVDEFGSDLVMPRSVLPALAVLAAGGARLRPIAFDADGLNLDERVEFAGLSSRSLTYRILRDVEAQMVRDARAVIVRSEAAAAILAHRAGPPIDPSRFHTVTNGRDEARFTPGDPATRAMVRAELYVPSDAPLLVYAGSTGTQYRFDLIAELTLALLALRSDTRLLVLTGDVETAARELAPVVGQAPGAVTVRCVGHDVVPRYLAAADIGLAFRQPSFSMRAVAPIKISEYLLCGLAVIGTSGIGDTTAAEQAGVFLSDAQKAQASARWIAQTVLPERAAFRERARQIGVARFSLARAVADYARALETVIA